MTPPLPLPEIRASLTRALGAVESLLATSLTDTQQALVTTIHETTQDLLDKVNDWGKVRMTDGQGSFNKNFKLPPERDSAFLGGHTALVFEPYPLAHESLRLMLNEWGMKVVAAADVSELQIHLQGNPNLIILSIRQEHLDCGEIDEWLNLIDWTADYRVLVLTDGINAKAQKRLLKGGVHACFPMPLQMRGLKRAMFRLLHSRPRHIPKLPKREGFRRRRRPSPEVLVVEHDPVIRERICNFLAQKKACVHVAGNGMQALEQAARRSFDLVLIDIHRPRVDGIEIPQRLRAMEPYGKEIPIIGLTASGSPDDHAEFLKAGVNECLHKPVDISTLWSVMVKWIPDAQATTKPLPQTSNQQPT